MVVETVKNGRVTIRVHDDYYKDRTKEEIDASIRDCCRAIRESLVRQNQKGKS